MALDSRSFLWLAKAFTVNIAGCLALVYIATRPTPPNDPTAGEGQLAWLLILGSLWAAGASFFTMQSFLRATSERGLQEVAAGLLLAVAFLPLSALLNLPDITPNPIAAIGGNLVKYEGILYAACMIEYFVGSATLGAILIRYARKPGASTRAIVLSAWLVLAVLYAIQLPIAQMIGERPS